MKPTTLVLLTLAVVAPLTAYGGPKEKREAKERIARAAKAHQKGDFDQALVELQAAYRLDPQPDLLYAIAQVYVKLGNCKEATAHYDKFVKVSKDKSAAAVVKQAKEACKEKEAEPQPTPEPPPTPAVTETPAVDNETPPPPPTKPAPPPTPVKKTASPFGAERDDAPLRQTTTVHRSWYTDKLADVLVVGGVAAAAVGAVFYRSALSDLDKADASGNLSDYNKHVDDAQSKRTYSVVLMGGGAALFTFGVARYLLHDRGTEVHAVGIAPARGGGLVTWEGRF